ncbi:hypothetical protein [Caulobacter sp.]|uniref:hypothetical protein n=1 Tax=Caulobacter sp. TaxID=78 RepID=UPI0016110525
MTPVAKPSLLERSAIPIALVGLGATAYQAYKLSLGEGASLAAGLAGLCFAAMIFVSNRAKTLRLRALALCCLSIVAISAVGVVAALRGLA